MPIHLIRHGHAGNRSEYVGNDAERPLSGRGPGEAVEIGRQLAHAGIDLIWSSEYVRCRQTVEPLAAELGLEVIDHPALAEGGDGPTALDALLEAVAQGHTVAACSHGDVIPAVVQTAVRRGAVLHGPPSPAKGDRYEIEVVDGRATHLTHIPRPRI